jgi:hypothetical protein
LGERAITLPTLFAGFEKSGLGARCAKVVIVAASDDGEVRSDCSVEIVGAGWFKEVSIYAGAVGIREPIDVGPDDYGGVVIDAAFANGFDQGKFVERDAVNEVGGSGKVSEQDEGQGFVCFDVVARGFYGAGFFNEVAASPEHGGDPALDEIICFDV